MTNSAASPAASRLLTFLLGVINKCEQTGIVVVRDGLPEGVQKLLHLATTVPEKTTARSEQTSEPFLSVIGNRVLAGQQAGGQMLTFLGETVLAFGRLLRGKAGFRGSDLSLLRQQCTGQLLPVAGATRIRNRKT
jgi:phospholipid/cholesterol/gamma-HCH transport system permease protein